MSQNPGENAPRDLDQRPAEHLPDHHPEPDDPNLRLSAEARAALDAGVPDSTRRAYKTNFRDFAAWCAAEGRRPLPATQQTVVEYTAYLIRTPRPDTGVPYSPSSIERVLAAIRAWHRQANWTPPDTTAARRVLSGYRSALADSHDPRAAPRKASPAVPARLRTMLAAVDRTAFAGRRDAALLLLGYSLAARSSELVSLDIGSITRAERGIEVHLWRKKVKKWQDIGIPFGSRPETCPVRATLALVAALYETGRDGGPLFLRTDRHGRIAPPMTRRGKPIGSPDGRMSPEAAADVVEKLAAAAGMDGRWIGHSLRRGFVNGARAAGHDLVAIGRHGGWADGSKSLLGYIDEAGMWDENPLYDAGL